jgi:hypothetical protein
MLPLGIRNKNIGNIRPSNPPWQGAVGENGGFVVFDTMPNGIRALAKQLMAYQDKYGINTVRGAINRWAPPNENQTSGYIALVCTVLECGQDDHFNFHDPDFLFWMVTAIGEEENGHDAFTHNVTDADINAGVNAALGAT